MRQLTMPDSSLNSLSSSPLPSAPRLRLGKLCVAIQAGSAQELIERAEAALKDAKFLEFRLDSLPKPAAAMPGVKEFLAAHREVTAIATCRRKEFGGHFAGALKAELDLLIQAAQAGCQIVDLEVESAEEAAPRQWDTLRAALIWSRRRGALKFSIRILSKWFRPPARWPTTWRFSS
jgi:3-dehydroquinate dehydratase/shikimate dehydrogenase